MHITSRHLTKPLTRTRLQMTIACGTGCCHFFDDPRHGLRAPPTAAEAVQTTIDLTCGLRHRAGISQCGAHLRITEDMTRAHDHRKPHLGLGSNMYRPEFEIL